MMRGRARSTTCLATATIVLGVILSTELTDAGAQRITYAYRWMLTSVAAKSAVQPPWTLKWERGPIWFERWKPAGFSESPSRRLALGPGSLVTVLRGNLYGLDPQTGQTLWTRRLQGDEIFDWRVSGDIFVYASYGHHETAGRYWDIRSAMDLRTGKELWTRTRPTPYLRKEWLLIHDRLVVYGDDRNDELAVLELADGVDRWAVPQATGSEYPVRATWFARGTTLYSLAGRKDVNGLFLKGFALATGRRYL